MALQVAFLRAINVGNRRVSMDRLRAPFGELGFEDVTTFIASGNVIFRAARPAAEVETDVEAALRDALGFEVVTFVRAAPAVSRIVRANPFEGSDDSVHVGFLKKSATATVRKALDALGNETDAVTARGKEVYWLAGAGMGRATISGALLEKTLGRPTTFRSLKMLKRLETKLKG
jgi:uncharacterized protein (DUF1697 family)